VRGSVRVVHLCENRKLLVDVQLLITLQDLNTHTHTGRQTAPDGHDANARTITSAQVHTDCLANAAREAGEGMKRHVNY
jgi:hypothetical protein